AWHRLGWGDRVLAAGLVAWVAFVGDNEPDWYYFIPTMAAYLFVAALTFAVTVRWRFALIFTALLFLGIYGISWFKYEMVAMKFHVYDVVFHGFSPTQFAFFVTTFPKVAAAAFALLGLGLYGLWRLWRAEPRVTFAPLLYRLAVAGLAGLGAVTSARTLFANNADFFTSRHYYLSSFIFSFGDLGALTKFGGLVEAHADPAADALPVDGRISCAASAARPSIVLFLNESTMPPGIYPNIVFPDETKPLFTSFDGKQRRLRVETFGGATWLSDFSALTGLSTWSFGSMRNFVAPFMTGRVAHSLPQYLKACGYETTMIYPSKADFAGSDRFYQSIGFDHLIDRAVHAAPDERQRDSFYLGLALEALQRGAKTGRPQFIAVSNMGPHSPWDYHFDPKAGQRGSWNGDAELDEYMWRLVLAERDRKAFRESAARSMPQEKILFVSYGDHQPALKKIPLKDIVEVANDGRSDKLPPTSIAFETYFAVDGQNMKPVMLADEPPLVEIPYLSSLVVKAAGLPLDAVYQRRLALMKECSGLYHTCADRQKILTLHRWLADSGYLKIE
ncbi:MAG: sulfatase-like hydrolase/transferase, partial [Beijerinckiaceae bacterium]